MPAAVVGPLGANVSFSMSLAAAMAFACWIDFPPSSDALEELFDGAPPACIGLGMVDIDWKGN